MNNNQRKKDCHHGPIRNDGPTKTLQGYRGQEKGGTVIIAEVIEKILVEKSLLDN